MRNTRLLPQPLSVCSLVMVAELTETEGYSQRQVVSERALTPPPGSTRRAAGLVTQADSSYFARDRLTSLHPNPDPSDF